MKLSLERLFTFGIGGNGANSRLDQLLEIGMEQANHICRMWRDVWSEGNHAVRILVVRHNDSGVRSNEPRQ